MLPASNSKKSDRKVPPRRPDQRLETLHRFLKSWLAENVSSESLESPRDGRADGMLDSDLFGANLDWNSSAIMDVSKNDSYSGCKINLSRWIKGRLWNRTLSIGLDWS